MSLWRASQGMRAALALAFPALWLLGADRLLAVALPTAALGYLAARLVAGTGRRPLSEDVTPLGDAMMTGGALALASKLAHARGLIDLGLGATAGAVAVVFVLHLVLPRFERGDELPAPRRRIATGLGLVAEAAMLVALLTVAAQNLTDTLAGPAGGTQLLFSPWPAWLGLGFAMLPMLRCSLPVGTPDEERRHAIEAVLVGAFGVMLVGWTGAGWWV